MNVTNNTQQNVVWWELTENASPTDEQLFLEVLKKCAGEEVSPDELKKHSVHIIRTKAPETEVGQKAAELQKRLYEKFPQIFGLVTVLVGAERRVVPRGYLESLDPHFANSFSNGMHEERTCEIRIALPEGVDCAQACVAFIERGALAIDAENALPLLQLALFAEITSLGEAVASYLVEHWSIGDDFEAVKIFIEFLVQHEETPYLTKLKYFIFDYFHTESARSPAFSEFIKTLDANHPMIWMQQCRYRVSARDKKVSIEGRCDSLDKLASFFGVATESLTISSGSAIPCATFPNLTALYLRSCSTLSNEQLEQLGSHCQKSLKELIIEGCPKLTSVAKNSYLRLESVVAKDSSLTDEGLISLSEACPHLKQLDLAGSKHISSFKSGTFTELEELDIRNCPLSLEALPRNLKAVYIGRDNHTEQLPTSLPSSLEILHLYNVKLTTASAEQLAKTCKNLKNLTLEVCKIEGEEVPEGFSLPALEELTLTKCGFSYQLDWFKALCNASLGNLKKLSLNCIDYFADEDYPELEGVNFSELRELHVKNCTEENCICRDSQMRNLFSLANIEAPKLSVLHIEHSKLIANDILALSATAETSLKQLILKNTKLRTLHDFTFSHLEELELHNASIIDEDLQTVSRTSGNTLKSLRLSKCRGITTFEGTLFPNVTELVVRDTSLLQKGNESIDTAFPAVQKKTISANRFQVE